MLRPPDVAQNLRKWLIILTACTLVLYCVVIGFSIWSYNDAVQKRGDIARETQATVIAICALKRDLHQRIDGTRSYLKEHPNGSPALGVSAAELRMTIANSERTLRALTPVNCTIFAPPHPAD